MVWKSELVRDAAELAFTHMLVNGAQFLLSACLASFVAVAVCGKAEIFRSLVCKGIALDLPLVGL